MTASTEDDKLHKQTRGKQRKINLTNKHMSVSKFKCQPLWVILQSVSFVSFQRAPLLFLLHLISPPGYKKKTLRPLFCQLLWLNADEPDVHMTSGREKEPAPPVSERDTAGFPQLYGTAISSQHAHSTLTQSIWGRSLTHYLAPSSPLSLSILLSLPLTWRLHPVVIPLSASSSHALGLYYNNHMTFIQYVCICKIQYIELWIQEVSCSDGLLKYLKIIFWHGNWFVLQFTKLRQIQTQCAWYSKNIDVWHPALMIGLQ